MPNAESPGGILVPAPWKWCRMIDEEGEVRLSYAAISVDTMSADRSGSHRVATS